MIGINQSDLLNDKSEIEKRSNEYLISNSVYNFLAFLSNYGFFDALLYVSSKLSAYEILLIAKVIEKVIKLNNFLNSNYNS